MPSNYMIFATGRGASYGFMLTCEPVEVTQRCGPTLASGFEVFVYEITPSPAGNPGFVPLGGMALKRVWHLWDAHDEFRQDAQDIINKLDAHSMEASREYLAEAIQMLQTEQAKLATGS